MPSSPTPWSQSARSHKMSFPWAQEYRTQERLHALARPAAAAAAPRLRRDRARLSGAAQPELFLELRSPRRDGAGHPDRHRNHPRHALRALRPGRLPVGRAHHARRQPGLAAALPARQRRQLLLHRHLHPHLPRPLLRLLQGAARAGLDARPRHPAPDDGDRLHGLRPALGADELLGVEGDHRPVRGDPAGRRAGPVLAARRLRAGPADPQPLLLAPLSAAVRDRRSGHPPHLGASHPGLEQPDRGRRQDAPRTPCPSIPITRRRTASGSACS